MNSQNEGPLVVDRPSPGNVVGAMAKRLVASIQSLGRGALTVFGLLGVGLIGVVAWRHDAVTIGSAVALLVLVAVGLAWFRAEADEIAYRLGYLAFRRRQLERLGYYELPDDGPGIPRTGWGLLPGSSVWGTAGSGGAGGEVHGEGDASGGDGGHGGGVVLPGIPFPLGNNGGNGGLGGKVFGKGNARGGRGGNGTFPGGGGGGGGAPGSVTPDDDDTGFNESGRR